MIHWDDPPVTLPETGPEPIPGVSEWCADGTIHDVGTCPLVVVAPSLDASPVSGPLAVETTATASIGTLPDTGYGAFDTSGFSLLLGGLLLLVVVLAATGFLVSRQTR